MKPNSLAACALSMALGWAGCQAGTGSGTAPSALGSEAPKKTLQAFRSDLELASYLRELGRRQRSSRSAYSGTASMSFSLAQPLKSAGESVTNVQQAGVDEGGIVKVHGDHLVVLRRGRLFTVSLAHGGLEPVSSVDAFSPDVNPRSTWYDELLVSGDTVVVIGYSYERGGTEANLFHIDQAGGLAYRSTYQLRSNDYYSSRNYASRLVGTKLIFYAPLYLNPRDDDPFKDLPAVRKWHKGARRGEFRRIVAASDVYKPAHLVGSDEEAALHTVTSCELAGEDFDCRASSVIGPPGRVFYVSQNAVYVWATDWVGGEHPRAQSLLYRMPLSGSAPSALGVSGSPVDQFSFQETEDRRLNVLVRSYASGDGMWDAESAGGDVALLQVGLGSFADGSGSAAPSDYQQLPKVEGYGFQNRFAGDYLLYGTGSGWGDPKSTALSRLVAVRWTDRAQHALALPHGVDRIEPMGRDAVVVGTDGRDLHFTALHLRAEPELAGRYTRKRASQGELRSQGFFYQPDTEGSGTLGLPISAPGRAGHRHLFQGSAAILFLRNVSGQFTEMGELSARPDLETDDHCRASCVDWYGNARPLFVRGRILALLGYELVEGEAENERMTEVRRVRYAPKNLAQCMEMVEALP
jgi:Beta propeller domain